MSHAPLNDNALAQLFTEARTFNRFSDRPVSDETIRQLHENLKWGPTSMNTQPARFVFVRSAEAKAKLIPTLSPGNQEKTQAAPLTVIVAWDTRFFDELPTQFRAYDAKPLFEGNADLAQATAFRNSTLQGAYLILAARALGLDSGAMSGFDADKLNAAFFPDGKWKANFLINIGYGDPAGNYPRGPRLAFEDVVRVI
ncbi:3-hydroxypropanoate dehydrogenase [Oryzomicrobium terrae]|uniref:Putative NADH dehydrogenase/NAD(P)H nitroreductase OTERR_22020 n=1 Tax=Oryzomicrobium terrae TaxID=1735038 RepID=A0A5C1EBQ7_9RHOO|nr:malonic semialdehyde reductase [Oryzomicrobium terrae]QEL65678.1 3-hydroxypropanoate dehydrogenase [Oryzomicrobium terrae]